MSQKSEQRSHVDLVQRVPGPYTGGQDPGSGVQIASVAELPTRFGDFRIVAFHNDIDGKEHVAIVRGEVAGASHVPTRLHSECLTGDAIGSLRCDCRDQLETALRRLGRSERGLLLYLRQEGRGIGLLNKVCAYALQDRGLDTVDANLALGFEDDSRDYTVAARMIQCLEVESIQLMTNNPKKIDQLKRNGVKIAKRVRHEMSVNPHNRFYLETKAERSGHLLDMDSDAFVPEERMEPIASGSRMMLRTWLKDRPERPVVSNWAASDVRG
jgi:GTP cyclohydrolase II